MAYGGVPWSVFGHDALKRLEGIQVGTAITSFAYDGLEMIAEYDAAGALLRRHVHGPGVDEPLVTYEGSGLTARRFLHADERGSIVALSDSGGAMLAINTYDEFGKPGAGNVGRFQYTGQAWLSEVGLHYYKARMYAPHLGRFLQTDPIGYADNANLYAYVGNDPINWTDPLGLEDKSIIVSACGAGTYRNAEGKCIRLNQTNISRDPGMLASSGLAAGGKSGGGRGGGGGGGWSVCPSASRPSAKFMSNTTNEALNSVPGGGESGPLSTEFSRITKLPNFRTGAWKPVGSSHARAAYEHALSGSDMVVKVYLGDHNFGNVNTVTITSSSDSLEHYVEFIPYALGHPVNTGNANEYLRDTAGC